MVRVCSWNVLVNKLSQDSRIQIEQISEVRTTFVQIHALSRGIGKIDRGIEESSIALEVLETWMLRRLSLLFTPTFLASMATSD